jgi:hypothetical protein
MKSITLLYPDDWVMKHIQGLLRFKNFHVLSIDREKGVIHAVKKRAFRQNLLLDLNVNMVDSLITDLHLSISPQGRLRYLPVNTENEEEKLVTTIQDLL